MHVTYFVYMSLCACVLPIRSRFCVLKKRIESSIKRTNCGTLELWSTIHFSGLRTLTLLLFLAIFNICRAYLHHYLFVVPSFSSLFIYLFGKHGWTPKRKCFCPPKQRVGISFCFSVLSFSIICTYGFCPPKGTH